MITKVIKIGNSRGIRIPKSIIEQSSIKNEVELEIDGDKLIIRALPELRNNWEHAFQNMKEKSDDTLLDDEFIMNQSQWDEKEWNW